MKPKVVVLMGAPGSGKGTQAKLLVDKFGFAHIASGDLVREVARSIDPGDELAKAFRERMEAGIPQPDDAIIELVRRKLGTLDLSDGLLFDAFPLSVPQAEGLEAIVTDFGFRSPVAVLIALSKEEAIERISKRRFCASCHASYLPESPNYASGTCERCGESLITRSDDQPGVVAKRYSEYVGRLQGMENFYRERGTFVKINGEQTIESVFRDLTAALETLWKKRV